MTPTGLYFKDSKLILLTQYAVYHQTKKFQKELRFILPKLCNKVYKVKDQSEYLLGLTKANHTLGHHVVLPACGQSPLSSEKLIRHFSKDSKISEKQLQCVGKTNLFVT